MRFKRVGIVVAAVAALAMGAMTSSAYAGTGPAPGASSGERTAVRSTAPSAAGNPASARAQASGVCDDAYQIGATTYLGDDGNGGHWVSLKQFYSPKCQQNYGYIWVWDSYLTQYPDPYEIRIGVWDKATNKVLGQVITKDTRAQEFWSQGTSTVKDCTRADGYFISPVESIYTQTALRC
ncbi:hypothetical protein [Streptomyces sp. TS71-3]|uniref:hypothetical protein n=1 Tax=Streptomyces sp. TS71-3 TaxID=2733862 RepID=UPI001B0F3C0D|nr:hypothetical protein [Streptomyces sp. TS71-3]GHJ34559.1 hypothetical protein Sm713_01680 [Streptomyces sp. TS71-3]